jgi:hypothetical protein
MQQAACNFAVLAASCMRQNTKLTRCTNIRRWVHYSCAFFMGKIEHNEEKGTDGADDAGLQQVMRMMMQRAYGVV